MHLLALVAALCFAADRPRATDWPANAELADAALGAEFLVHSVLYQGHSAVLKDYVVVEVALYPGKRKQGRVTHGQFMLRVNMEKVPRLPQSPAMAAASVKYPDWSSGPRIMAGAGVGDAAVILGRPRPIERFPGDPRPQQDRLPQPPRAPQPEDRSGVEQEPPPSPEQVILNSALEEGDLQLPVRGCLYFPYRGNAKKIRTLELIYSGPFGEAVLKLH